MDQSSRCLGGVEVSLAVRVALVLEPQEQLVWVNFDLALELVNDEFFGTYRLFNPVRKKYGKCETFILVTERLRWR